jgi:hypothetical protein
VVPKNIQKPCKNLFILFQRPATSFQPAGSVGLLSLWTPWAPETFESWASHTFQPAVLVGWAEPKTPWAPEIFKNPVKPHYFVTEASHIIPPAGSVGWAKLRGSAGPGNIQKPIRFFFSEASHTIPASMIVCMDGPSSWAPWAPETLKKPVKSLCFVSEASHIIPASRIGWMGQARGRRGPQKHSKTLSNLFILFQRPATSFQPAGSVGWAEPMGAEGPRNI